MRTSQRRTFLKKAAAGLALPAARALAQPQAAKPLPSVALGKHRVSRLIAGANPITGYGHSTRRMDELMLNYFTVERTIEFLLHCEQQGITTWQTSYSPKVDQALCAVRDRGSKIQVIFLASDTPSAPFDRLVALKPIGIVHHGGVTDDLFTAGKPEKIHDYVKRVKDAGLLAGVSTHNPDNLARVDDSNWENDFYMTCMYFVKRPAEEIRAKLGDVFLGETFLVDDPKRMAARVRQIKKTCLAFKILGAGRLCRNKEMVEKAFAFTYSNIKPTDAAIVGMFPILFDEVKENCDLVRKYA